MHTAFALAFAWTLAGCAHGPTATEEVEPIATGAPAEPEADVMEEEAEARREQSEHAEHERVRVGGSPEKPAPLCGEGGARIASSLRDYAGVDRAEERITIVVTLTEGASTPALLQDPLPAGPLVQGSILASQLCELATIDGVESIREPIEASPK